MNILSKDKVLIEFDNDQCGLTKENTKRKGKGLVVYGVMCVLVLMFLCLNLVMLVDIKTLQHKRNELVNMKYNSEVNLNTLKKEVLSYKKDMLSKEEDYQSDVNEKQLMEVNVKKLYKEKENEVAIIEGLKRERDVLAKTIFGYEIELKYLQDELKQIAQQQS